MREYYIFTFGQGQEHAGHYVKIFGTYGEAGWTLAGIAREIGVSQQTIENHLKKVGMK